jgi:hypothetical protein
MRTSKLPKRDDPGDRRCGLCGESCEADQFCNGCRFYICEDHNQSPWGEHDVTDHELPEGRRL